MHVHSLIPGAFDSPPSIAASVALEGLNAEYKAQLSSAWKFFCNWTTMLPPSDSLFNPSLINHYIASVCTQAGGLGKASRFRASVSWFCAMFSIDRPLDLLTWKLLKSLQKTYLSEGRFWLASSDVLKIDSSKDRLSVLLQFLIYTGLRPLEFSLLTKASIHESSLKTMPTKHRPEGRTIMLSPKAKELAELISVGLPDSALLCGSNSLVKFSKDLQLHDEF